VFTQPDRPAGRGRRPTAPAIKTFALEAGIQVLQPEKIRDPANRPLVASLQPDAVVVAAYGQILPPWLLQIPRLGCVNVHGSLLPRYRGAAPVAWAVLNGDSVTGITTMLMDEQLDTGPMLLQEKVEIGPTTTTGELTARLAEVGADLLIRTLDGLSNSTLRPIPQDHSQATYAPRITKEAARVDWTLNAAVVHNQVRGLNPWPLAYADFCGTRVQLLRSLPPCNAGPRAAAPATFLGCSAAGMIVSCGASSELEILELQPSGKKKMSGRDFANGFRLKPGDSLTA
jgi:methionyl-tRNA formyltransferase